MMKTNIPIVVGVSHWNAGVIMVLFVQFVLFALVHVYEGYGGLPVTGFGAGSGFGNITGGLGLGLGVVVGGVGGFGDGSRHTPPAPTLTHWFGGVGGGETYVH